ncbi:MAG: ABC transporter [Micrococcales bacterium 73-13]|nr:MAG: ABC transporter [Micrococcales bacterium 73-13]
MSEIIVDHLQKVYVARGQQVEAIRDISFNVRSGEFVCVVGPSGGGKSTLLKCLSGILPPTNGQITLGGKKVVGPPEGLAMVYQNYTVSLLPWMSVEANVSLPLRNRGLSRRERTQRADEALESVGIGGFKKSYPWQLSGGMQQRVAIARAIAYRPECMLMDEPFASVDAQTRAELEDLIIRVHREHSMTTLFVTHDIDESIYLADRVVVLSGRPSVVRDVLEVDLPYPRDHLSTKALPKFGELRAKAFHYLRGRAAHPTEVEAGAVDA